MSEEQANTNEVVEEADYQATKFTLRATFQGHNQSVCDIKVDQDHKTLVSTSRDKTALVWDLSRAQDKWATPKTRLCGHNHFVTTGSLTYDVSHLLTSSWDATLRLWKLSDRTCTRIFHGHKGDILTATFSPCNRIILSGSRDKTVRIWNILGVEKTNIQTDSWVTSIVCAPVTSKEEPVTFAYALWNGKIAIYRLSEKLEKVVEFKAHDGRCTSLSFTPDGKWLVSGGSDRKVSLWEFKENKSQRILSFTAPSSVNFLTCAPSKAWICAATYEGIAIWDIQHREQIDLVQPNFEKDGKKSENSRTPECTCLAWAADSTILYSGYNDGVVRAWEVKSSE